MSHADSLERFFEVLVNGDRPAARALIEGALRDGAAPGAVLNDLCFPGYEKIEQLFRDDQLTTVGYHLSTRLLRTLVDQIGAKLPSAPANALGGAALTSPLDAVLVSFPKFGRFVSDTRYIKGLLRLGGTTTIDGAVTTSGTQTYLDAVSLLGNATLTGTTVTTGSTLTGGDKALAIVGNAVIGGDVSAVTNLSVSGTTTLAAASVATTGTQNYGGLVTLGTNTTLTGTTQSTPRELRSRHIGSKGGGPSSTATSAATRSC
jgi:hypothetical protein